MYIHCVQRKSKSSLVLHDQAFPKTPTGSVNAANSSAPSNVQPPICNSTLTSALNTASMASKLKHHLSWATAGAH